MTAGWPPRCGSHDTTPAARWEDAYPVGNGRHGALVHGDPWDETVVVNHHHLVWPDRSSSAAAVAPPDLSHRLGGARDLLLAGASAAALALLTDGWPDCPPRPFHPAFAIRLRDARVGQGDIARQLPAAYRRTLDYRTGVAAATWQEVPGQWWRGCFVSRARDVVVQSLTAPPYAPLDLAVELDVGLPGAPPGLETSGHVRELAPGDMQIVACVRYPRPGPGGYVGVTRVVVAGGTSSACQGPAGPGGPPGVRVGGGRELLLLTRVEPFAATADANAAMHAALAAVGGLRASRRELTAEHARLHAAAYGNVRLSLNAPGGQRAMAVSELLSRQAAQPDEPLPALLEKLFDSGRYLLMSASGLLPPRLTGLWQGDWNAAWSGAVTTNANLGLQLAGAVTTDVPAAIAALADHVRDRLPDWRENARRLFGCRGIAVPAQSDGLDGRCAHFAADYPHQLWTAGADWLLAVLVEAVDASEDEALGLRVRPALRELAMFYEDFLTRTDEDGHLIFVPSYSPENAPRGWSAAALNATMDIAAARHALLAAAASAAGEAGPPGFEKEERRWRELASRLPPYRVNADGALAEWAWPPAGSGQPPLPDNYDHRHISHLYPVWPLHEITAAGTPELAAAALRALRLRGAQDDSAHGYLHKALVAARLRDARLAGQLLAALTGRRFFFRSLMSSHYPRQHVYNADAACALPGVLTELLVDSAPAGPAQPGWIELLPAVPDFLPSGRLRGIRTRTGVLVADLHWDLAAGRAEVVLVAHAPREIALACRQHDRQRVTLPATQPVPVSFEWPADPARRS
ncbi:MAG: glycoside hydrolase N-terminal domain-containing protein [Trebonia sp.]